MVYLPLLYVYIYIIIVLLYRLWATNQSSYHLLNSYMIATSFCLSWGLLKVIACFPNWLITIWGVYCFFLDYRKSKPKLHLWIWATANIYSSINSSLGSQLSGPKWNLEGVSLIYCYYLLLFLPLLSQFTLRDWELNLGEDLFIKPIYPALGSWSVGSLALGKRVILGWDGMVGVKVSAVWRPSTHKLGTIPFRWQHVGHTAAAMMLATIMSCIWV